MTCLTAHSVWESVVHSSMNIFKYTWLQLGEVCHDLWHDLCVNRLGLDAHAMIQTNKDFIRWCRGDIITGMVLQSKYKFYSVFRSSMELTMTTQMVAWQRSALPWAQIHPSTTWMGSGTASLPVLPADPELPLSAIAAYKIHVVHTHAYAGAAAPSPCSPACNISASAHLLHAYVSVSPNAQEPDHPSWIL